MALKTRKVSHRKYYKNKIVKQKIVKEKIVKDKKKIGKGIKKGDLKSFANTGTFYTYDGR